MIKSANLLKKIKVGVVTDQKTFKLHRCIYFISQIHKNLTRQIEKQVFSLLVSEGVIIRTDP
jgi:hypothetical protein